MDSGLMRLTEDSNGSGTMAVHSTAIVDKSVEIESSVEVGPYAIIEGRR